jgi:hypothetical protein
MNSKRVAIAWQAIRTVCGSFDIGVKKTGSAGAEPVCDDEMDQDFGKVP